MLLPIFADYGKKAYLSKKSSRKSSVLKLLFQILSNLAVHGLSPIENKSNWALHK
jgi:hypothetical protein